MPPDTKDQLVARAQLVRIHEANCRIEHPSADEMNFRRSIMIKLGLELGLKEIRTATINPPGRS